MMVESPKHLLIFPASKTLINHDEVVYVIHQGWDVIIRNYVCNQYKGYCYLKLHTPTVITYTLKRDYMPILWIG